MLTGDCDFESGGCSWNDRLVGTQFNWTRHQGRSPSWYTGPESDHTTGTHTGYKPNTTGTHTGCKPNTTGTHIGCKPPVQ